MPPKHNIIPPRKLWVVVWAVTACMPALNIRASATTVAFDPRVELIGVVSKLAGVADSTRAAGAYASAVDSYFAEFKGHPAVELTREALTGVQAGDLAIHSLYYSDPPDLKELDGPDEAPYTRQLGGPARVRALLDALRDFARTSKFMRFYSGQGAGYRRQVDRAEKDLAGRDVVKIIERYLGLSLQTSFTLNLSHFTGQGAMRSFIIPYPNPPVPGPFRVHSFPPAEQTENDETRFDVKAEDLLSEPLFVFVEIAVHSFDEAAVDDREEFYGPAVTECPQTQLHCVKSLLVSALEMRLTDGLRGGTAGEIELLGGIPHERRYVQALAERLREYERDRKSYPTLAHFLPRLLALFAEHPEGRGIPARVPLKRGTRMKKVVNWPPAGAATVSDLLKRRAGIVLP